MARHRKGIFAYITIMLFMLQALGAPPLVGIANAQTTLDPGAVRAFAALKGLKSLRVAIQEDAAADLGLPLLLEEPLGRNVPLPKNLKSVLNNKNKDARKVAAQLGKALFWDMALGSDGNACASCHFHAGADNRFKNQLSPDITRVKNIRQGDIRGFHFADNDEDLLFQHPDGLTWGPNYTLDADDFPFVQDIGDGDNVLPSPEAETINPANKNTNDVASSQGVFFTQFVSVGPNQFNENALGSNQIRDDGIPVKDGPPQAGGKNFLVPADNGAFGGKVNVRRVEPRNTPTNINAVFNFHNFWDGRANHWFNGVNPFGRTDKEARIFTRGKKNTIATKKVQLNNSSLASQAVGPPLSVMEMSFAAPGEPERMWPDVGKKMVGRFLLESQTVDPTDSLLGELLTKYPDPTPSGKGIKVKYGELIKEAFDKSLWDSDAQITLSQMSLTMLNDNSPLQTLGDPQVENGEPSYSLMEANFSLFFGVAVMLYQAELVADDTPFDQFMAGNDSALSDKALLGLAVFVGAPGVTDGRCVNCHGGPELTNASVRNAQGGNNIIEPMIMGDFQPAFYDNGFYNISVTPTAEDRGRGDSGPEGKPLSSSRQFLFDNQGIQNINFPIIGAPIQGLVPVGPVFIDGVCQEPILQTPVGSIEVCRDLNCDGACGVNDELLLLRVAVDGAFKTPGLRNQELMGPYMHNGGLKTLLEVVEFYDRGGNFCRLNFDDLDPDVEFIGLTAEEEEGLVALMIEMTDERVRNRQAPFDHPELRIPNGHPGDHISTTADSYFEVDSTGKYYQAEDLVRTINAVGATGGADIEDFHVGLSLDLGFDGHMEAGAVDSDVNVDGAPKCNRPNPAP